MCNSQYNKRRFILSGGGTGGHIFPALSVAHEIRSRYPDAEILFIGAKGRMEMEKVPAEGFPVKGLWISGMERKLSLRSVLFPVKLIWSMLHAAVILIRFKPSAVAGFGGYASGSTLKMASWLGFPVLIQEQNSFPGKTNMLLSRSAKKICVAYDGMDKFFDPQKIVKTGNPVRKQMLHIAENRSGAVAHFGLEEKGFTVLVVGGSQGALSINEAVASHIDFFPENNIRLIWQTGKAYYERAKEICAAHPSSALRVYDFIHRMDLAYGASDIVVSRAGAIAISEIALAGKPAVFIPLPTAAEDHQLKNALALKEKEAAWVIEDKDAKDILATELKRIIDNKELCNVYAQNIRKTGIPDAAARIVNEMEQIMR